MNRTVWAYIWRWPEGTAYLGGINVGKKIVEKRMIGPGKAVPCTITYDDGTKPKRRGKK